MPKQENGASSRLDRLVRQAQWVLTFEAVWPPVVLTAGLVAVFVAISWLGVWIAVPRPLRLFGVCCFAFALAVALFMAWRALGPSRALALRRLDRDSGLPHRPVSTVEDQLANPGRDPTTRALWALHQKRLEASLARVRVAPPRSRLTRGDPYALRAFALLVLVMAGFAAGPNKEGLIAAAFDWRGSARAPGPGFRVDAWVDPPGYTGRPPVVLFAPDQTGQADKSVTVPTHSIVVIRSSAEKNLEIVTDGSLKPDESQARSPQARPRSPDERGDVPAPQPAGEHRLLLTGKATLTVRQGGMHVARVVFQTIADQPPTIELVGGLKVTARGGLSLEYKIGDDYGVVGAEASFSDPVMPGRPAGSRSLVPPPHLTLSLPPGAGGLGTGRTTGDLSEHPWAGAEVTMVLSAKDEAGNIGLSAPIRVTLPSRPFSKPLARALVEQRRNLALDPDHHDRIDVALDALMIAPDLFDTSTGVYLGLSTAKTRLDNARDDQDLIGLSDFLWEMALRIEDGDLSQAQRDLRAAEQALREAMQRGASPEEIKRLSEQLRQAMNNYLAEMMRKSQGAQQEGRRDPNAKVVTPQDLQRMMKQMEDAARSGDVAEAQRLLDQLQNLTDHLQTAQGRGSSQASRELNRQMSELDKMTRDQQGLRDKTFKHGQQSRRGQADPDDPDQQAGQGDDRDEDNQGDDPSAQGQAQQQPGVDGGPSDEELGQQQQSLRQRLQELQKRMRDLGMKNEKGLGDAEQAMKDAEGALGQGPSGNRRAVEAQGRALQGLQQGAAGLAQQMAQGQADGEGQGQGNGLQGQGQAEGNDNDPLGRPRNGRGSVESRGNEIGESVAQRAQQVLEELRRRLGDPSLPQVEEDYLERLLKHY